MRLSNHTLHKRKVRENVNRKQIAQFTVYLALPTDFGDTNKDLRLSEDLINEVTSVCNSILKPVNGYVCETKFETDDFIM